MNFNLPPHVLLGIIGQKGLNMDKDSSKKKPILDIKSETAYLYLKQVQSYYNTCNPPLFSGNLQSPYKELEEVLNTIKDKLDQKNTERLYQKFHEAMELVAKHELNRKNQVPDLKLAKLDPLFLLVYENASSIENVIYNFVINTPGSDMPNKESISENLKNNTTDPDKELDVTHPDNRLNAFFSSMIGIDYHPLKNNNIPYIAFQDKDKNRTCIRMGAQTQKSNKINPTFRRYLLANARKSSGSEKKEDYEYVYINLLKKTADDQDKPSHKKTRLEKGINKFVRSSEDKRGSALELLNNDLDKRLKTAVITLPADGDFLLGKFSMRKGAAKDEETVSYEDLLQSIKNSINKNKNDFYIPNNIRTKLFGKNIDNGKLEELFEQAVTDVIGDIHAKERSEPFNPAQRNAILVQFVKFNLSNYILDTLNPRAYNFSCKDGIDRGAIHTLWYHMNLMHSKGTPMSQKEFLTHLDSPALIVKYRPLNENRNLIWNTLKNRMEADIDFASKHSWAHKWLELNDPARAPKKRLSEAAPAATQQPAIPPAPPLPPEGLRLPKALPRPPAHKISKEKEVADAADPQFHRPTFIMSAAMRTKPEAMKGVQLPANRASTPPKPLPKPKKH